MFIIFLFYLSHGHIRAQSDRGLEIAPGTFDEPKSFPMMFQLNTKESFKNLKKNDVIALIVGNNDYTDASGFLPLKQCINDTRLLSRLLNICCKIPRDNIIIKNNISRDDFTRLFDETIARLKPDQSFLFYYSGHGRRDGSLIFIEGEKITPHVLKEKINSFKQDTTLILDACYSGNNEGPIEREENKGYKKNCIRIYSSLAHMISKEIKYSTGYFSLIKPFYEDVLQLKDEENITGNGYFTSFIGYFFAEYDFLDAGNVSFWNMMTYVTNKSKNYVEYLAIRNIDEKSPTEESFYRLHQLPKIFPYTKKVLLQDPNHEYLLIKNYIRPIGLVPEFSAGPFINFGILSSNYNNTIFQNTIAAYFSAKLTYRPFLMKGFFMGPEVGYIFTYRKKNTPDNEREIFVNMVPLFFNSGYHHYFSSLEKRLSFRIESGVGISINVWDFKEFKSVPQMILTTAGFCFQGGVGLSIHPAKNVSLSLDVHLLGIIIDPENLLLGLKIPVVIAYKI